MMKYKNTSNLWQAWMSSWQVRMHSKQPLTSRLHSTWSTCTMTCIYSVGMLSKSKGQVLRLSTTLHLLFHYNSEGSLPDVISEAAIKAAIDFVKLSCEQTSNNCGKRKCEWCDQKVPVRYLLHSKIVCITVSNLKYNCLFVWNLKFTMPETVKCRTLLTFTNSCFAMD